MPFYSSFYCYYVINFLQDTIDLYSQWKNSNLDGIDFQLKPHDISKFFNRRIIVCSEKSLKLNENFLILKKLKCLQSYKVIRAI